MFTQMSWVALRIFFHVGFKTAEVTFVYSWKKEHNSDAYE